MRKRLLSLFALLLTIATGAWAQSTTYTVKMAEGTEDATNWTISPTEAAKDTKITATYSGTKRVKSVTAVVKPASTDLSKLTADYMAKDGEILTGTLGGQYKITISDGATVTLDNVSINANGSGDSYNVAGLTCAGDATIILSGTNTVKGFSASYPGIFVPISKNLTIQGEGSLDASSNGSAAGIGGGMNIACGNITIAGGTITATGGEYSAGIGGGFGVSCGNITITNGVTKVTATKGNYALNSIGAGYNGSCGTVTIGGVEGAISTSPYTYQAPAEAKTNALGWDGDLAKITAESTAEFATAIDGMTITGTLGVDKKVSIADGAKVTLDGVTINGVCGNSWAGINCVGDATITLSGENTLNLTTGNWPGIYVPQNKTVTIQGDGSLNASANFGAGIGGGYNIACGNITIAGGNITAGGGGAAGIGGGQNASCGNILISGGTVIASGDDYSAAIGGGDSGSCGNITITSGVTSVTATAGGFTSKIGAGFYGSCGTVTIEDPSKVTQN